MKPWSFISSSFYSTSRYHLIIGRYIVCVIDLGVKLITSEETGICLCYKLAFCFYGNMPWKLRKHFFLPSLNLDAFRSWEYLRIYYFTYDYWHTNIKYNFFFHQLDAQTSRLFTYNTLIKIFYIFRALPCSSSGGPRRNCIYAISGIVTLCRWLSCVPVKKELFDPAGFIIPDGNIVFIQFYFDLFVLVYLSCLLSIANLDDCLTMHHSITFLSPTWCTDFLFIYI